MGIEVKKYKTLIPHPKQLLRKCWNFDETEDKSVYSNMTINHVRVLEYLLFYRNDLDKKFSRFTVTNIIDKCFKPQGSTKIVKNNNEIKKILNDFSCIHLYGETYQFNYLEHFKYNTSTKNFGKKFGYTNMELNNWVDLRYNIDITTLKLWFYILYISNNLVINLDTLMSRLDIKDKNNRRVKSKLSKSLETLKQYSIITDYEISKNKVLIIYNTAYRALSNLSIKQHSNVFSLLKKTEK